MDDKKKEMRTADGSEPARISMPRLPSSTQSAHARISLAFHQPVIAAKTETNQFRVIAQIIMERYSAIKSPDDAEHQSSGRDQRWGRVCHMWSVREPKEKKGPFLPQIRRYFQRV